MSMCVVPCLTNSDNERNQTMYSNGATCEKRDVSYTILPLTHSFAYLKLLRLKPKTLQLSKKVKMKFANCPNRTSDLSMSSTVYKCYALPLRQAGLVLTRVSSSGWRKADKKHLSITSCGVIVVRFATGRG
jgi:hypothetical protein